MSELKPCPLCQKSAMPYPLDPNRVGCRHCYIFTTPEIWNSRAPALVWRDDRPKEEGLYLLKHKTNLKSRPFSFDYEEKWSGLDWGDYLIVGPLKPDEPIQEPEEAR